MRNGLNGKLCAYSAAAGAAALGLATAAQATVIAGNTVGMTHYDFTAAPIFVGAYDSGGGEWISGNHDLMLLKTDGTVVTNPLDESLGQSPSSFSAAQKQDAFWFTLRSDLGDKGDDYGLLGFVEDDGDLISDQYNGSVFFDGEATTTEAWVMYYVNFGVGGLLPENNPGYLGFQINGIEGWARMTVAGARNEITLHEFAVTPEPASMAMLAVGAAGLLARRKRK